MANEEEVSQNNGAPAEKAENTYREVHSTSRSASLDDAHGKDVEKSATATVEKVNSTANSSEKNSIASEKVANLSRGTDDAAGEREPFKNLIEQQQNERMSQPGHNTQLHEETGQQLHEETGQQPSRRLSPISYPTQQRSGTTGTPIGQAGALPVSEKKNREEELDDEAIPEIARNPGRRSRRELQLRRALRHRLLKKPQHFARLRGAAGRIKHAHTGWCKFICAQALTLSLGFGLLSVLLLVAAVTSSSWRTHNLTYEDANGVNIVTVHAGLYAVQRIHKLTKYNDTAILYLVDAARSYRELIDSPYCLENVKEVHKEYRKWRTWLDKDSPSADETPTSASEALVTPPARRLSETNMTGPSPSGGADAAEATSPPPKEDWPEESGGTDPAEEETDTTLPVDEGTESHTPQPDDEDGMGEEDTGGGGKTGPPNGQPLEPFELVFGRDPAAAGNMTPAASKLRRALLGPVIFELNCRYLPKLKRAGKALWSLIFPALVLSAAALVISWLSSRWVRSLFRGSQYPTTVILFISTLIWLLVVILTVAGLASWGAISDVAACVSDTGGAAVCMLGPSSALAVAALALQVLAALCCGFCIAGARDASKNRTHRDVRVSRSATPRHDQREREQPPFHHNRREPRCLARRSEGPKDVAIEVLNSDHLPSGERTPPTVAGQEQSSRQLTNTEWQSEEEAADTRRDAPDSRLRSLLRQLTYLGGIALAKLLPGCFAALAPQPLKQVAPQVGAIVAAAVTQTMSEVVDDMY